MHALKQWGTALGVAVLLPCLLSGRGVAQVIVPRQADTAKKCAICHYRWVAAFFQEGRSTPIASANAPDDVVSRPEMCLSCHDGSVRDSRDKICNDPGHRIGIKPSNRVKIPETFPLDDNGCMRCATCHTPHAVPQREGHLVDFFLRAPNRDSSFCILCHEDHAGGAAAGSHPAGVAVTQPPNVIVRAGGLFGGEHNNRIICQTCHIAHGGVNSSFLVLPVEDTQTLSILCEACHTRHPGKKMAHGSGFSHPVDVLPGGSASIPARWPTGEPVVRGKGGELVCRTCHRPHQASGKRFLLTGQAGKDAQCLCCHPMQALIQGTAHDLRHHPSCTSPGICTSCHAVHEAALKEFLWARPGGPPFLSERDKNIAHGKRNVMVSLCTGCHQSSGCAAQRVPRDGLHPAAFATALLSAAEQVRKSPIPLYTPEGNRHPGGGIVCSTCHNVHQGKIAGDFSQTTRADKLLRPAVSETLCSICHGAEGFFRFLHFHTPTGRFKSKQPFPFGTR
ncbi:MAG: cytochrome c3 family protein [Desulfobacterota bacterium]|nr:cytochrome c3 family protein [Thermodesulfobacteriota bacterium]